VSKSPELYSSKALKVSVAAFTLFSLSIKPEFNHAPQPHINHQIIAKERPHLFGYTLKPAIVLINNYLNVKQELAVEAPKILSPAQIAANMVTPTEFAQWSKVNICEEHGNWHVVGSKFQGGLGISVDNWASNGGIFFAVSGATATPDEQIVVAMRVQGPAPTPDQNGKCKKW